VSASQTAFRFSIHAPEHRPHEHQEVFGHIKLSCQYQDAELQGKLVSLKVLSSAASSSKSIRQTLIMGLITLVLSFLLVWWWSELVSSFRSGETSMTFGPRDNSVTQSTWKENPVGFTVGMAFSTIGLLMLSVVWLLTLALTLNGVPDIIQWIKTAGGRKKFCTACKTNCTDEERFKDDDGNYFCKACYESRCMACGDDCTGVERIADDDGHLLCPGCFDKRMQVQAELVELQADLEQFQQKWMDVETGVQNFQHALHKVLDIHVHHHRAGSSGRGIQFGIRGWLQLIVLALLVVGIMRLFDR
jgi:hypothetical protein